MEGVGKRRRVSDPQYTPMEGVKRQQQEQEETAPENMDCPLCAQLVTQGKQRVLGAANSLENPKAKQVGGQGGERGGFGGGAGGGQLSGKPPRPSRCGGAGPQPGGGEGGGGKLTGVP